MTMRMIAACAAAMIAATWLGGWWGVVVISAAAGIYYRAEGGRPWRVALAAVIAWTLLLLHNALGGPLVHVSSTVASAMGIPAPALLVVMLLLAALLAWSAAIVAAELAQLTSR